MNGFPFLLNSEIKTFSSSVNERSEKEQMLRCLSATLANNFFFLLVTNIFTAK